MPNVSVRAKYLSLLSLLSLVAKAVTSAPLFSDGSGRSSKRANEDALSASTKTGYIIFIVLLVILSGITAGLTLGLMSLDETQLYVLSQSGSKKQKEHALKIIPIRKNGHLLLVSLLLLNVISNETLPIISEKVIGSGPISIVVSTVMIVIFSEILPQAICSTHGLAIGAAMAVPVKIAIVLMFVVAWPVAKLLDLILGENHGMVYRRAELKELIDFHSKTAQHGGDLSIDAVTIMRGALDLQEKKVKNSMTYIDDVFMLPAKAKLDRPTIQRIFESGHSRIPIYEYVDDEADRAAVQAGEYSEVGQHRKIIGCLLAKNLLLLDPDDEVPLAKVSTNTIPSVQDDLPLFDILNIFQEGRSHLAVVVNSPTTPFITENAAARLSSRGSSETIVEVQPRLWTEEEMSKLEPVGIITLEDVLEELIQEPIWDETDAAQERPRAGLAVPIQGTSESLILTTNRGRPISRATREVVPKVPRSPISRDTSQDADKRRVSDIELANLQLRTSELADWQLSRSNSAAPADARLSMSMPDPFADEYDALVERNGPSITNKHLSKVRVSRPLTSDMPVKSPGTIHSSVSLTGPGIVGTTSMKSRFKSRSTSSSQLSSRRTQSAHNVPGRRDHFELGSESSSPAVGARKKETDREE